MSTVMEQINSAGSAFVEFTLPMLVQSSVLIVILLLLDFALRKKVRAVFRYWIWMLVLIKLILPSSLSSPTGISYWLADRFSIINVGNIVVKVNDAVLPASAKPAPVETINMAPTTLAVEPIVTEPSVLPAVSVSVAPVTWQAVLFLIWLAVVSAMAVLLLQRAIFVCGLVAQAKDVNSLMNDTLDYCRGQMKLRRKVGLKVSANATSPAVCGLFRPVILIPENLAPSLGASGLRAVLMHELAHIKRGDLWVNLAQTILQIIYFYNPLLWLANWMIRRVREQAVDEMVLVAMGEKAQQYSQTLVDVAKLAFKRPALSLRLIGVVESKSALAGRVKRILNRPIPKTAKLGIAGLLAIIITGAVLLPMARAKDNKPEKTIAENPSSNQFKATLPNGVTVELVGVCEHPSEGKQWWRPNGTLLKEAPYDKIQSPYLEHLFPNITADSKRYELALMIITPTETPPKVGWRMESPGFIYYMEEILRDGRSAPQFKALIAEVSSGDKTIEVKLNINNSWIGFKNVSLKPNFKTDVQIEVEKPAVQIEGEEDKYNLMSRGGKGRAEALDPNAANLIRRYLRALWEKRRTSGWCS